MRVVVAALAFMLALPGVAVAADYRIVHRDDKTVAVVDFSAIKADSNAIKHIHVYTGLFEPKTNPNGQLFRYADWTYGVDCSNGNFRVEGLTVYGPDFKVLDSYRMEQMHTEQSWGPLKPGQSIGLKSEEICGTLPGSMAAVGHSWRDALDFVINRAPPSP